MPTVTFAIVGLSSAGSLTSWLASSLAGAAMVGWAAYAVGRKRGISLLRGDVAASQRTARETDAVTSESQRSRQRLETEIDDTTREPHGSQERFRSAFDFAAIGIALVDLDGRWLRVSRALCELVGYSESELLASTFQAITHPDDLEADLALVAQLVAGEIPTYQMEKRYVRKDGAVVWVLLSVSLMRDSAAAPLYFISQIQDVTAAKEATERLTRSEGRFRQLFEANGAMQWLVDPLTERIVDANAAAARFYGYPLDELRGKPLDEISALAVEHLDEIVSPALPGSSGMVVPHRLASGEVRLVEFHPTMTEMDGRRLHHIIIFDVTERTRSTEALRESERRLSQVVDAQSAVAVAGRDLDVVMQLVAEQAREMTQADASLVEMAEGDEMVYRAVTGAATPHLGLRIKIASSLSGQCVRTGELLRCDDSELDPRVDRDACRRVNARSMVVVPLIENGRTVGVLKVYASQAHHFDDGDAQVIQLLAASVAAAIANATAFEAEQARLEERTATLTALNESESRFRDILATVRSVAVCLDTRGRVTYCNDALLEMTGWTREDVLGRNWFDMFVPRGSEAASVFATNIASGTIAAHLEHEVLTVTGERRLVSWDHTLLRGAQGEIVGSASLGRDVTALRVAEHARERLTTILDASPDAVAMACPAGRVLYTNVAARLLLGVGASEDATGKLGALDPQLARDPVLGEAVRAAVREGMWQGEREIKSASGAQTPIAQVVLAHRSPDGVVEYFSTIIRDITDRKRSDEQLRALSLRDDLTGLYNRRGFMTLAEQHLRLAKRGSATSLLFYFDLNDFKSVNDVWGHAEGDEALRQTTELLRKTFRDSDILARMGGDEFVALAVDSGDIEEEFRERLNTFTAAHNASGLRPYAISFGVGTARLNPSQPVSLETLMANADANLYVEKRRLKAPPCVPV